MSHLNTFLSETKTSQAKFAEQAGFSRSFVSELVSGIKRPSLDAAFLIERITMGRVPAASWVAPETHGNPLPGFQHEQTDNLTDLPQS